MTTSRFSFVAIAIRSRSGKKTLLRYRIPRRADRSRVSGSRIVRRFSHHVLHRSRTGILFSPGGGRRNLRIPARLAQAAAKSALRALSKRLAIFPRADPLLPLQPALASFHSLDTRCTAGAKFPPSRGAYRIFISICCRRREKFRRRAR